MKFKNLAYATFVAAAAVAFVIGSAVPSEAAKKKKAAAAAPPEPPSRVLAKRPRRPAARKSQRRIKRKYGIQSKRTGRCFSQRPVFNSRRKYYFLRGGIWSNSAICSLVNGFSRNFNFTASATAPSRSANLSVCSASFGWNFAIDSFNKSTGR